MILSLLEKFDDALCRICESNYLLDWITRLGMSDEGHLLTGLKEAKPVKKVGRRLVLGKRGER